PVEQHLLERDRAGPAGRVGHERPGRDHVARRRDRRAPDPPEQRIAGREGTPAGRAGRARQDERGDESYESSGQKSGLYSGLAPAPRDASIPTPAPSGSSFHTDRNTSGATRTAVPRSHSITSSSSLNWSFPEMTK